MMFDRHILVDTMSVVIAFHYRATWHTLSEMPAEIMNDDDSLEGRTTADSISIVSTPYSQESEEVVVEGKVCEEVQKRGLLYLGQREMFLAGQ
jgi:hypothetical protein